MKQKQEESSLSSNPSPMLSVEDISDTAGLRILDTEAITSTPPFANVPLGSAQNEDHTPTIIANAVASGSHTLPLIATESRASTLSSGSTYGSELMWSSWPQMLPEQSLLLHLYVYQRFVSSMYSLHLEWMCFSNFILTRIDYFIAQPFCLLFCCHLIIQNSLPPRCCTPSVL